MMKRQLLLWIVAFFVGGCWNQPLGLSPVKIEVTPLLTPVYSSVTLTSNNCPNLTELASLADRPSDLIASLAFNKDGQELLAVYSGREGFLDRWQLKERKLTAVIKLGPVGVRGTALDSHATRLAISAGEIAPAVRADYTAKINGTTVWDTSSGRQILDTDSRLPMADVSLSPDGRWLAEVTSGGLSIFNVDTNRKDLALVIGGRPKPDYSRTAITAVAIDPTGKWAAYADDEGIVEIEDQQRIAQQRDDVIWSAQIRDGGIPLALVFDLSRSRLAAVTTKSLTVWELNGSMVLSAPLPNSSAADVIFNPTGELLAVGTSGGWQIWSVADGKLLLENNAPTYAVAFSPDSRLFAWGDTKGVVHIWGVKE